jgi:hypothetical protein
MGISLVQLERYCFGCNRFGKPNISIESKNLLRQSPIELCFDCVEAANDVAEEFVGELVSTRSSIAELTSTPSLIPNRAVEFVGITIKDSIQLGDRIEYISYCDKDLVTGEKKIGFVIDDKVCKLTQYEYIMQGWVKVSNR